MSAPRFEPPFLLQIFATPTPPSSPMINVQQVEVLLASSSHEALRGQCIYKLLYVTLRSGFIAIFRIFGQYLMIPDSNSLLNVVDRVSRTDQHAHALSNEAHPCLPLHSVCSKYRQDRLSSPCSRNSLPQTSHSLTRPRLNDLLTPRSRQSEPNNILRIQVICNSYIVDREL